MGSFVCHGRTCVRAGVAGLVMAALAWPVSAQIVKRQASDLDRLTFSKRELRVSQTLADSDSVGENLANRADMSRFKADYGSAWHFTVDKRTGQVNLVDGGAIPFIPGPANKLRWEDYAAENCRSASCIPQSRIESIARDFLRRNRGALQVNPDDLVLKGFEPIGNSVVFLRFQWVIGGVPVEGGSVSFAVNNGNLVQIGIQNIGNIRLDPKPAISTEKAWEVLKSYVGGASDKDQILDRGSLAIVPITPVGTDPDLSKVRFGKMIDYVLVYKLAFRRPGVLGTWEALVNAHTGELLRFRDSNVYGHIQGGVYKTDKPQTEVTMPFAKADYGAGSYADTSGDFAGLLGTSTMTGLNIGGPGVSGGVKITDNCGSISLGASGSGLVDFGNAGGAGTDCTTPGFGGAGNTHSARTQFWNVTEIKMKGISYLPGNTWLQGQIQDVVNINQTCNAYWDGIKLNFFKSGGGCSNTGELPGVSLHEWGHGMDSNDGSGGGTDNRPVESRADWTALLQTHQSCTGGGFFNSGNCSGYGDPCSACSGIRDADYAQHTHPTPWTPQNNGQADPGYSCSAGGYTGPCGWEDHCESGIATQALWDFVNRDLVGAPTNLDLVSAWQLEDRLFYIGMPQSTNMYTCTGGTPKTSDGCGAGSLYTVMRSIDDDGDGTGNGTPHAAAIFAALNRHGIACGAAGDPANQNQTSCPALTTPTLTATADSHQVTLNWTSGGVERDPVFRLPQPDELRCGLHEDRHGRGPDPDLHGHGGRARVDLLLPNPGGDGQRLLREPHERVRHGHRQPPAGPGLLRPRLDEYRREPRRRHGAVHQPDILVQQRRLEPRHQRRGVAERQRVVRHRRHAGGRRRAWRQLRVLEGLPQRNGIRRERHGAFPRLSLRHGEQLPGRRRDDGPRAQLRRGRFPASALHRISLAPGSDGFDPCLPRGPDLDGRRSLRASGAAGLDAGPGDYLVIDDNNKAQRNLDVSHNTFHFAGLAFALIHNSALFPRDMVLRFDSPAAERLRGARVEVVGGGTVDFRSGGTVTLPTMQPGENRWIAVRHQVPEGGAVPIHFLDVVDGKPVNGFTVLAGAVSSAVAIRENLRDHVQVFNAHRRGLPHRGGPPGSRRRDGLFVGRRSRRRNISGS